MALHTTDNVLQEHLEYLVVDEFLDTLIGTRVLKSALELGLIDELESGPSPLDDITAHLDVDGPGTRLLIDLLASSRIVEESAGRVALTPRFSRALEYRDLLETKLDFIGFVLLDFIDRFNSLIVDPGKFMRESQVFRLFDYQRSVEPTTENYAWTKVWMRLTTALTKYEAGACMHYHDFGPYRRMLDIGGNSGEFVLRVCKAHPRLQACVMDLPVVCEFGQDHVLAEPERERISFLPGSALDKPIPSGFDLISFKSMLHDWPEATARRFIARAVEALEPGGTLLIFERAPLELGGAPPPLSLLPILMFARSYRPPSVYERQLSALGFRDIEVQQVHLETTFFILTARKSAPFGQGLTRRSDR